MNGLSKNRTMETWQIFLLMRRSFLDCYVIDLMFVMFRVINVKYLHLCNGRWQSYNCVLIKIWKKSNMKISIVFVFLVWVSLLLFLLFFLFFFDLFNFFPWFLLFQYFLVIFMLILLFFFLILFQEHIKILPSLNIPHILLPIFINIILGQRP